MLKKLGLQIKKGAERLKEIKEESKTDEKKLESLIIEKTSLLADIIIEKDSKKEERVKKYSKEIEELRDKLKDTPALILALEKKLKDLESEKEKIILKDKIGKQRLTGLELCSVSKKFIKSLKETQALNKELRGLWNNWNSQKEQTSYNELPGKASLFSYDMLNYLSILISEYEGRETRKREYFSRVRI